MAESRFDKKFQPVFIALLAQYLVTKGLITVDMLEDIEMLKRVFRKHLRKAIKKFPVLVSLDSTFATEAFTLWDKGAKLPALVLFATAIEQAINMHYRLAFMANGTTDADITSIIRTHNLEAKVSWLMGVATKSKFPIPLGKRLRAYAEIRNSIVHYKAIPGQIDKGDDGSSTIKKRISKLGRVSLRRDYRLLNEFLQDTIVKHDPSRLLAHKVTLKLMKFASQ